MKTFRNILTVLIILLGTVGYGQTGRIAPIGGANVDAHAQGTLTADSLMRAAGDTIGAGYTTRTGFARNRGLAVLDGIFYYFDGQAWVTPATGAGGGVTQGQLDAAVSDLQELVAVTADSMREELADTAAWVRDSLGDHREAITSLEVEVDGKQNAIGYAAENVANKVTNLNSPNNTTYPSTAAVNTALAAVYEYVGDTTESLRVVFEAALADTASVHLALINGKQAQLNGTGFLKANGATISYDSTTYYPASNPSSYISGNQTITASGDVTGSGTTSLPLTLSNSGVSAGSYGSGTVIPGYTVDAKGRITGVTTYTPTPAIADVTGMASGMGTFLTTPSSANLRTAITDETGAGVAVFNDGPLFKSTKHTITAMAANDVDGSLGNLFTKTLSASPTITFSNISVGQIFTVVFRQGSGTTYSPTWPAGITWETTGATAPTQTTVSNGYTTYVFICTATNTFLGYLAGTN